MKRVAMEVKNVTRFEFDVDQFEAFFNLFNPFEVCPGLPACPAMLYTSHLA